MVAVGAVDAATDAAAVAAGSGGGPDVGSVSSEERAPERFNRRLKQGTKLVKQ